MKIIYSLLMFFLFVAGTISAQESEKPNPDLPVVRGNMPDIWIHGYMSMPREMKSVRTLQKDIYSLELLNTLTNFWSGKRVNGGKAKVTYSSDDISAKAVLQFTKEMGNPHNYSRSFTVYKNLSFIELNWFIDGKQAEPWPEAGWISFPFKVDNPEFKVGRLGAVIDPAKDIVKGSDFDFYLINSGIALLDNQKNGFDICTSDAPGVSLDRPGLWKYSGQFIPQKANVFVNLYNNQWSTNFTEWIESSWSAKMYLWSFQGYKNEESLISPSEEFRSPLKAVMISGKPGNLPAYKEGVRLFRKGVLVTSFGPNAFGEETVLRLWEQSGDAGKCKISLSEGVSFSKAVPINLRGENAGNAIAIKDNSFEIEIGAYKPASFLIEM